MGVGEHLFECERDRKETKNDELVDWRPREGQVKELWLLRHKKPVGVNKATADGQWDFGKIFQLRLLMRRKKAGKVCAGDLVADHRPLGDGEELAGVGRKNQGRSKRGGGAAFAAAPSCCPTQ